jgi:hypothetical protein
MTTRAFGGAKLLIDCETAGPALPYVFDDKSKRPRVKTPKFGLRSLQKMLDKSRRRGYHSLVL